jgi:preprotein translocase subunit SecE
MVPTGAFFSTSVFTIYSMSISDYIKDTRGELKHVSWPTRSQAIAYTVTVILIAIVIGIYLGLLDYIFSNLLEKFVL